MAELSSDHIIEIVVGSARPSAMRMRPGETLGPMSLGTEGAWRVEAPGVAPEHAEIYFNGVELYIRSVDDQVPAIVDGLPVRNAWTSLIPPCELSLGEARIRIGAESRGATAAPAAPAPQAVVENDSFEFETEVATRVVRPKEQAAWQLPQAAAAPPPRKHDIADEATVAEPSTRNVRQADRAAPWGSDGPGGQGQQGPADAAGGNPFGDGVRPRRSNSTLTRIEPLTPEQLAAKRKAPPLAGPDNRGSERLAAPEASPSASRYPKPASSPPGRRGNDAALWGKPVATDVAAMQPTPRPPANPTFMPHSAGTAQSAPAFGTSQMPIQQAFGSAQSPNPPGFGTSQVPSHPAFGSAQSPNPPTFGPSPGARSPSFGQPPISSRPMFGTPPGAGQDTQGGGVASLSQLGANAPPPVYPPQGPTLHSRVPGSELAPSGSLSSPRLSRPAGPQQSDSAAKANKPPSQPMSLPKMIITVLFLPMMLSVVYLFMGEELGWAPPSRGKPASTTRGGPRAPASSSAAKPSPSARPPTKAGPAASASTQAGAMARAPTPADATTPAPSAGAPATTVGAAAQEPDPSATTEAPEPSASAPPRGLGAMPDETEPGADDPEASSPAAKGKNAAAGSRKPDVKEPPAAEAKGASGKTLQREAADAVAAGAYARAAKLYDELAQKYPNKPAYAEAATILRAKATPAP